MAHLTTRTKAALGTYVYPALICPAHEPTYLDSVER